MESKKNELMFSNNLESAILVHIVKKYKELVKKHGEEASKTPLGRTKMQKICYFLKFVGTPLPYSFKLYNYGPFCQELLSDMEFLQIDGLINDSDEREESSDYHVTKDAELLLKTYKAGLDPLTSKVDDIVELVSKLDANGMELFSTTHYTFWAYKNFNKKNPSKKEVVSKVYDIKKRKFLKPRIEDAFDQIKKVGMFEDIPSQVH